MKNNYFLSQVHQIFFALSFVNAIVFMLVFMLSYKGVFTLVVDINTFHSFSLIFLLFTPAFLGFVFTTFPRFLSSQEISKEIYLKIFAMFVISTILFLLGAFLNILLFKASMFIIFIALLFSVNTLYRIHNSSLIDDKYDTYYILLGFSFSFLSLIIFISGLSDFIAIQIAIFNFLFVVAFAVAQRMIPFFSHIIPDIGDNFVRNVVILLLIHSLLELVNKNYSLAIDLLLSLYITRELYKWKLPFPNENAMISILHIALFWVPISFFISYITKVLIILNDNIFLALDIHTLMLGFLFTLLIGFGTRVTLGHSGNKMYASKYTKFLFIWTQIVVFTRIIVSIVASLGYNFMIIFDISITFWLLMFIFWLYKYFFVLIIGKKLN